MPSDDAYLVQGDIGPEIAAIDRKLAFLALHMNVSLSLFCPQLFSLKEKILMFLKKKKNQLTGEDNEFFKTFMTCIH